MSAYTSGGYIFPIIAGVLIYLRYNASAIALLGANPDNLLPIDAGFFAVFLSSQGFFSFLLTAYAAPGLVGPDLSNNALPLYLCRPISRAEYVLGKMAVLLIPLSLITWVPGALLWMMQAGLDSGDWGRNNLHLLNGGVAVDDDADFVGVHVGRVVGRGHFAIVLMKKLSEHVAKRVRGVGFGMDGQSEK